MDIGDKIDKRDDTIDKKPLATDLTEVLFSDEKKSENLERNDKEQFIYLRDNLAQEFDEFLNYIDENYEEQDNEKADMDCVDNETQIDTANIPKKGKKKRKLLFNIAIVNFGSQKCKKNSKKFTKNTVFSVPKLDKPVLDSNSNDSEFTQSELSKNVVSEITQNQDFSGDLGIDEHLSAQGNAVVCEKGKTTETLAKKSKIYAVSKTEKKTTKNSEKIAEKCEKIIPNSSGKVCKDGGTDQKDNATKNGDKKVFFVVGNAIKQMDTADKEKQDLLTQNEALRKENLALKKYKNQHRERGFVYAEILSNKSKKDRIRDELLAELQQEKLKDIERKKREDKNRENREEKTHDLIRQQKDIQYGMDYIRRKADRWRVLSAEAYTNAMLHFYTDMGNRNNAFGIDRYNKYMMLSIVAMKYCMDYQHDLDLEQEKLLQKERELEKLMQR